MERTLNTAITLYYLIKRGEFSMTYTFKKDHLIVDVWYRRVRDGICEFEQVPKLFNLRDCVMELLSQKVDKKAE
ncbi:hypothetical protein CSDK_0065 [Streptococcus dysgalactiae]|nr:hypothetical protein EA458_10620 [Streptococcus dysgalactiae subsp. dysgalactiae]QGH04966.1 hypothetical protein EA458_11225 [Streptococcus dysgalactiae subsp. dysgalactiae]